MCEIGDGSQNAWDKTSVKKEPGCMSDFEVDEIERSDEVGQNVGFLCDQVMETGKRIVLLRSTSKSDVGEEPFLGRS